MFIYLYQSIFSFICNFINHTQTPTHLCHIPEFFMLHIPDYLYVVTFSFTVPILCHLAGVCFEFANKQTYS